jgi:hypothetical protein
MTVTANKFAHHLPRKRKPNKYPKNCFQETDFREMRQIRKAHQQRLPQAKKKNYKIFFMKKASNTQQKNQAINIKYYYSFWVCK